MALSLERATDAGNADRSDADIVEFRDAPTLGLSLFVHASWTVGLRAGLPADPPDATLCRLLACDGERAWEGRLRRADLAGPLGESWGDLSNVRLLLDAFAAPQSKKQPGEDRRPPPGASSLPSPSFGAGVGAGAGLAAAASGGPAAPAAESVWTCRGPTGSPLELAIRFVYREGPVTAVRGVKLPPIELREGLEKFFSLAHGAQVAATACATAVEDERVHLQSKHATIQQQLETLPAELEEAEERLLKEFASVLNAQKSRCRALWEAARQEAGTARRPFGELLRAPAGPGVASFRDCLDREAAVPSDEGLDGEPLTLPGADATGAAGALGGGVAEHDEGGGPFGTQMSLTFATQPPGVSQLLAPPGEGAGGGRGAAATSFSIPLTLGMAAASAASHSSSLARPAKRACR